LTRLARRTRAAFKKLWSPGKRTALLSNLPTQRCRFLWGGNDIAQVVATAVEKQVACDEERIFKLKALKGNFPAEGGDFKPCPPLSDNRTLPAINCWERYFVGYRSLVPVKKRWQRLLPYLVSFYQATRLTGSPFKYAMTFFTAPLFKRSTPSGVMSAQCGVRTTCSQERSG
jgi:hypothetical protein